MQQRQMQQQRQIQQREAQERFLQQRRIAGVHKWSRNQKSLDKRISYLAHCSVFDTEQMLYIEGRLFLQQPHT